MGAWGRGDERHHAGPPYAALQWVMVVQPMKITGHVAQERRQRVARVRKMVQSSDAMRVERCVRGVLIVMMLGGF